MYYVPIDFTCDDPFAALLSSGYDPQKKTFFSWLSVSMYLDRAAIEWLLDEVPSHAAKGSSLVFEHLMTADIQKRYFDGRDDDLSAFPCICFAHAVVQ